MAIKTKNAIDAARLTLRDNFGVTHTHSDAEFIDYVNRAVSFIVGLDSSSFVVTGEISLVVGSFQKLPDRGVRLLKLFNNNGVKSYTEIIGVRRYTGVHSIKEFEYEDYIAQRPDWAGDKSGKIAIAYSFNKDDPTSFIVYPPNDGTGTVMGSYSALPTEAALVNDAIDDTQEIGLQEIYFNPLIHYMMFCALSRDGESSGNSERADKMLAKALSMLGIKEQADMSDTPKETVQEA